MNSKGFVISLDALVALLLLMVMLITASFYFGSVKFSANTSLVLREVANDTVSVLEKSGEIEYAIDSGKVSGIRSFLNKLPYSICADFRIYSNSNLGDHTALVLRPGCKQNFEELATASRSIVFDNSGVAELYLAELRVWYRVSE